MQVYIFRIYIDLRTYVCMLPCSYVCVHACVRACVCVCVCVCVLTTVAQYPLQRLHA